MSLQDYLSEVGEEQAQVEFSSFVCGKDTDVQDFLRTKAIRWDKKSRTRTYLLLDEDTLDILGYFSVALHILKIDTDNVSRVKIQKIDGIYRDITEAAVYLIGQLAKNDRFKDNIQGKTIIEYALGVIEQSYKLIGGRIALVECNEKLRSFYEENEFSYLQNRDEYLQMIKFTDR